MRSIAIFMMVAIGGSYVCTQRKVWTEKEAPNDQVTKDFLSRDNAVFTDDELVLDIESIYTDSTYTGSTGVVLRIQNSYPKGGPYTNPSGKKFGQALFWNRFINESTKPIHISIDFSTDQVNIPTVPNYKPQFYVYSNTPLYSLSQANYHAFLDTLQVKRTYLHETIGPGEESVVYVATLVPESGPGGMVRAEFILQEQTLIYSLSILPHFENALFQCGTGSLPRKLDSLKLY